MNEPAEPSFVPIDRAALGALSPAVARCRAAASSQRAALEELLELTDDLRADAVQRLRERGASVAQVERYDAAYERERGAARTASDALTSALSDLTSVAHELAEV